MATMGSQRVVKVLVMTSLLVTSCGAVQVQITSHQQAVTVGRGTSLVFTCFVNDFLNSSDVTNGQVIWGRIQASIETLENNGNKYDIRTDTYSSSVRSQLNITDMTFGDEATYYCSWRQRSDTTDYVKVTVVGQPDITDLSFENEPIAGQNVVIICTAEGKPLPEIEWSVSPSSPGQALPRYNVSESKTRTYEKVSRLMLYNVTSQAKGKYSCEAESDQGSTEDTIKLDLNPWAAITDYLTVETPRAPPIETSLGLITLYCVCFNIPRDYNVEVRWSFKPEGNNSFVSLHDDPRMDIVRQADTPLMTSYEYYSSSSQITFDAGFSDQGVFRCRVFEEGGGSREARVDRRLVVEDMPDITLTPDSIGLTVGEAVTLNCTIQSRPFPSVRRWRKNYVLPLPFTEERVNDYTVVLVHTLVALKDTDRYNTYSCEAFNNLGSSSATVQIEVGNCASSPCTPVTEYCTDTGSSYYCLCQSGYYRNVTSGLCITYTTTSTTTTPTTSTTTTITTSDGAGVTDENRGGDSDSNVGLYAGAGAAAAVVIIIIIIIIVVILRRRGNTSNNVPKPPEIPVHELPSPTFDTTTTTSTYYSNSSFSPFTDPHEYTPLKMDHSEFPRERLQLQERLGQGKFGTVVKGLALSLYTHGKWDTVAVKTHNEAATNAEKSEFLRELSIMRKLPRHPNVVSFMGCCTMSDPALILMEFCSNGDLLSFLRKRRPDRTVFLTSTANDLTARDFFSFALHVARGMAHVANSKIVHRDVAARNVLLSDRNVCKVSDFGLSRRVGDQNDVYEIVSRRPLPLRWMSPESLRDGIHTSQSDVWSYGVLLWELVTLGSSPYPGNSGKAVIDLVVSGTRPVIPPQCSGELADIMMSCWAMMPESRPTFDVIAKKFETLLENEGDYLQLDNIKEGIYSILEPSVSGERV